MVVGALSVVVETHAAAAAADLLLSRRTRQLPPRPNAPIELTTSFLDHSWSPSPPRSASPALKKSFYYRPRLLNISCNLAGQYDENFDDVKKQMLNYFTLKAVRTVMNQLYEMNPPQYRWFYEFVGTNRPNDGKYFIRKLAKERHELAERVMVTRLHLYGKWIKKCDHTEIYKQISDENLELMRERLLETVVWPSDDTNTEIIP